MKVPFVQSAARSKQIFMIPSMEKTYIFTFSIFRTITFNSFKLLNDYDANFMNKLSYL